MAHISTIKNPLTIIAIFAGIAEIGGTAVLPFVSPENQRLYIYFLITFPVLLVLVFFATLNWNHGVLYAPSDWKDEDNFFRRFSPATEREGKQKIDNEVREVDDSVGSVESEDTGGGGNNKEPQKNKEEQDESKGKPSPQQSLRSRYIRAERLGVAKLEQDTGIKFSRNVRFEPANSPSTVFDGMSVIGNDIHIAEVKYVKTIDSIRLLIDREMQRFSLLSDEFTKAGRNMILHLVYVSGGGEAKNSLNYNINSALSRAKKYNVKVKIYHYDYNDIGEASN